MKKKSSNTIKGILIDTKTDASKNIITACEIKNGKDGTCLAALYETLKCEYVDCVERKIGQHYYDIWCDDEALLNNCEKIASVLTIDNNAKVVENIIGSAFICLHDEEGNMVSLEKEQFDEIKRFANCFYTDSNKNKRQIVVATL